MKYKIKLDFTNQWTQYCMLDLIQIGFYNSGRYYSICLTFLGFGLDIDFLRK